MVYGIVYFFANMRDSVSSCLKICTPELFKPTPETFKILFVNILLFTFQLLDL